MCCAQLLGLQWVSSRLQCVLLDYCEAFNSRILSPRQFASGMVAAAPHTMNVVALGGALGETAQLSIRLHPSVAASGVVSVLTTQAADLVTGNKLLRLRD